VIKIQLTGIGILCLIVLGALSSLISENTWARQKNYFTLSEEQTKSGSNFNCPEGYAIGGDPDPTVVNGPDRCTEVFCHENEVDIGNECFPKGTCDPNVQDCASPDCSCGSNGQEQTSTDGFNPSYYTPQGNIMPNVIKYDEKSFSKFYSVGFVWVQSGSGTKSIPKCHTMDAIKTFGLPVGNKKTSDYNVMRVYLKNGQVLTVPPGGDPYSMYPGQVVQVRTHQGVDFSSHDSSGKVTPVPFKAGVYGTVDVVPGSKWNTVTVTTSDGSRLQYLHASSIFVSTGDRVTPDTIIGMTGDTSPTRVAIHLHVQAKDSSGKAIDPQIVIDKDNKIHGICK